MSGGVLVKRYAEGVFRIYGVPVRIRVGLNSGEVVVRDAELVTLFIVP